MAIRPLRRVSTQTRERAIKLRRGATSPEKILWSMLRARQLDGLKFRRQHPIEPYVVDFYCAEAKLVVELDGESHDGRQAYDEQRTAFLQSLGLKVFRVTNDDVMENLEGVAEAILRIAAGNAGCRVPLAGSVVLTEMSCRCRLSQFSAGVV